jgi:hypothetical protein
LLLLIFIRRHRRQSVDRFNELLERLVDVGLLEGDLAVDLVLADAAELVLALLLQSLVHAAHKDGRCHGLCLQIDAVAVTRKVCAHRVVLVAW